MVDAWASLVSLTEGSMGPGGRVLTRCRASDGGVDGPRPHTPHLRRASQDATAEGFRLAFSFPPGLHCFHCRSVIVYTYGFMMCFFGESDMVFIYEGICAECSYDLSNFFKRI